MSRRVLAPPVGRRPCRRSCSSAARCRSGVRRSRRRTQGRRCARIGR